jgi:dUTP pyrophosphatase
MVLKFKKLSDKAVLPIRAHEGDAGLDLTCTSIEQAINEARQILLVYHTDLAVEIPEGHVGLLFPRSSIYTKSISLTNCVGVIDSSYRGEIKAVFLPTTSGIPTFYNVGERFAQLVIVPIPEIEVEEAEELTATDRGEDGFGSTNNEEVDTNTSADEEPQSLPETEGEPINSEETVDQAADQKDGSEQV